MRLPAPPSAFLVLLLATLSTAPTLLVAQEDGLLDDNPGVLMGAEGFEPLESDLYEQPPQKVRLIGIRFRHQRLLEEGREALTIAGIRTYTRTADRSVYEAEATAEKPRRWMRADFVLSSNDSPLEGSAAEQSYLLVQTSSRGPWDSPISAIIPPAGGVVDLDPIGFKGRGTRLILVQPLGPDEEFEFPIPTVKDIPAMLANVVMERSMLSSGLCRLLFSSPLHRLPPARLLPLRKRLADFEDLEHRSVENDFHQVAESYDAETWLLGARLACADPAAIDELLATGVPPHALEAAGVHNSIRPARPLRDALALLAGEPHPDPRIAGAASWLLFDPEQGFNERRLASDLEDNLKAGTHTLPGDASVQQERRSLVAEEAARSAIALPLIAFFTTLAGLAAVVFGGRFVGRRLTLP